MAPDTPWVSRFDLRRHVSQSPQKKSEPFEREKWAPDVFFCRLVCVERGQVPFGKSVRVGDLSVCRQVLG
jgi:hypothetical protein